MLEDLDEFCIRKTCQMSIVYKILFPVYGDLCELKSVIFILLSMCDFCYNFFVNV